MCTLFANLYVLLTWGPHMVYMGTPYIFDIYMIRCGWLGYFPPRLHSSCTQCKEGETLASILAEIIETGKKVKSSMAQSLPSGESTTTECGFNYQLLAVILLK